jgi:hypothetical protein
LLAFFDPDTLFDRRTMPRAHKPPRPPRTPTTQPRALYETDLTDAQWEVLSPLLPPPPIVFGTTFAPSELAQHLRHAFMRIRKLPEWQGGNHGQTTSTRFAAERHRGSGVL